MFVCLKGTDGLFEYLEKYGQDLDSSVGVLFLDGSVSILDVFLYFEWRCFDFNNNNNNNRLFVSALYMTMYL